MDEILVTPVARVFNGYADAEDDRWGGLVSEIRLEPSLPGESLDGLESFSHLEVIFHFHLVGPDEVVPGKRRPRDNPAWPEVGIFAQRGRVRPNRLGLTTVRLLRREGRSLFVEGLDALDGTPVLDLKPVLAEFLPRAPVRQPGWAHEVMAGYWNKRP